MGIRDEEEIGVIQKIQGKTGCLLLLLGFALLAFILTEFINASQSLSRTGNNPMGEIAGETIDYTEFNARVENTVADIKRSNPQAVIDQAARKDLREQVWGEMIEERLIKPEYEALGIEISEDELEHITVGAEPHPRVAQAFPNQDGSPGFNRNALIQFLNNEMQDDEDRAFTWINFFEEPIKKDAMRARYRSLLMSTVYTTKLEAQEDFDQKNRELSAVAVGLPYQGIADSTLSYDDSDLERYLDEHSEQYQQIATRDVDMAVLEVIPSHDDSTAIWNWARGKVEDFKNSEDDSAYVELQGSEVLFDTTYKSPGAILDREINAAVFAANVGDVIGPVMNAGKVSLIKVSSERITDDYSMRAEHILVPIEGPDRSDSTAALAKARTLLAEIKSGAKDWNEEAKANFDGTGLINGDLGWTTEGAADFTQIQPRFKKALFKYNEGDYFVVLSNIGAHIGHVTGGKTKRQIQYAILAQSITPSSVTDGEVQRRAAEIQYQAQSNEDFDAVVEGQNLIVTTASSVVESSAEVKGIEDAGRLVRWMYEDGVKEGQVSEVLEFDNMYVIAKVTKIREEGTADFEDVRSSVETAYKEELKFEILKKQMEEAMQGVADADALAKKLNTMVRAIPAQRFDAQQVIGMGRDMNIQGTIFGIPQNTFSQPIKGTTGTFVVYVNGEIEPKSTYNEDITKSILNSTERQRADQLGFEALRAKGEIVDQRYKYY